MSSGRHNSSISSLFQSLRPLRSEAKALLIALHALIAVPAVDRQRSSGSLVSRRTNGAFAPPAGERGAQLIEFAITLPIAMITFTGLLSLGVYLNKSLEMTNATSLAGLNLGLSRGASGASDPCALFISGFQNVAPGLQSSDLSYTFTFSNTTNGVITSASYSATTCKAGSVFMAQGAEATIAVTYPCSIGIWGTNFVPTCQINSQVTEIIQ
jgi:Flp pilus assembly protein TadG